MMRRYFPLLLVGLLAAGPGATTAVAQSESGGASLEGEVHGPNGKAVPNASVRITATATGYARTVATRADGALRRAAAARRSLCRSKSRPAGFHGRQAGRRRAARGRDLHRRHRPQGRGGGRADHDLDGGGPDRPGRPRGQPDHRPALHLRPARAGPELPRLRPAHAVGHPGIGPLRPRHLRPALDQLQRLDRRRRLQRPPAGQPARRQRGRLLLPPGRGRGVPGGADRRHRQRRPHRRGLRQRRDEVGHERAPRRALLLQPQPPADVAPTPSAARWTTSRTSSAAPSADRSPPTGPTSSSPPSRTSCASPS